MKIKMRDVKAEIGWFAGKQVDLDNVYKAIINMEQTGYKGDSILKMLHDTFGISTTSQELNLFMHNREAEKAIKARKKKAGQSQDFAGNTIMSKIRHTEYVPLYEMGYPAIISLRTDKMKVKQLLEGLGQKVLGGDFVGSNSIAITYRDAR